MRGAYRFWESFRVLLGAVLLAARSVSAVPIVSGVEPPYGVPNYQYIVVSGSGFAAGTRVYFNGVLDTAAYVASSSQINCRIPALATTGPITVTAGGLAYVTTNAFVVLRGQPYISSFTPTGRTNQAVSIFGVNLLASKIWFTGALAGDPVAGPGVGEVRVVVPTGAVPGPITASNQWSAAYGVFTTTTNFFPIGGGPLISDFSPVRGSAGTEVVINGLNFYDGYTTVRFGTNPATKVVFTAGTQIHAWVPANAVTAPVSIGTPYGTNTTSTNFIVGFGPEVLGFAPVYGAAGTRVTIDGVNFVTGSTAVKLNGTNVAAVSVVSPTQLHATIQANASTGPFTVSTAFGTNSSASNFVVTGSAPVIGSFDPPNGSVGSPVLIQGDNLIDATNVSFGGVRALSFAATSRMQITATVPPGALNGPVSVVNPKGAATTSSNFYLPPVIGSLNPTSAPVRATITIAGTNLLGTTDVRFGGIVGGFAVVDNYTLRATVPTNAAPGFVTVATPGGATGSAQVFSISPSADLGVALAIDRNPVAVGESALLSAVVTNSGPNSAANVVLALQIPFFMAIESATATAGSVSTNATSGTAVLGSLAVSNTLTMTLKCRVLLSVAPPIGAVAQANVTAVTADLFQSNNGASLVVSAATAPTLLILPSGPTNVLLAWPAQWSNFTVQAVGQMPAGGPWQDLTNVPGLSGNRLQIARPSTNQGQVFRLKRTAP